MIRATRDNGENKPYLLVKEGKSSAVLSLQGDWVLSNAQSLTDFLHKIRVSPIQLSVTLDGQALGSIDTAGVFILHRLLEGCGVSLTQLRYENFNKDQERFVAQILKLAVDDAKSVNRRRRSFLYRRIVHVGCQTSGAVDQLLDLIAFFGQICATLARNILRPRRFRLVSIVRHIDEAGIGAIPIVALLAFLISIVMSYQAATQLKNFGADIFTVNLTVISILREMGVILTAIMVAGRSGSAYAAEIGVMKLREEVDALQTIGLDPFEILVLPRIIALVIVMPLLTFIADIVGLAGGAVMAVTLLDISLAQYIDRVFNIITMNMFLVGIMKAPVFAFLIALIGTWQGMRVTGSAESVGRLTTLAVVQSIFLVILADALFSILFANLGI